MNLALLLPDWPAPAHVRAAMSTRVGGVSTGAYASLNLGQASGDDPHCVEENRRRLESALQLPSAPRWLKQVHGARAVDRDAAPGTIEADASFSTRPGTVCAVQAADCLPVLLCDGAGTVVAAAHAGWRGLAAGVVESTVRSLPVKPAVLLAWLGPAIGPDAFEVGPEVHAAFTATDPGADACFRRAAPGKFFADLFGLARRRLRAAGVTRIHGGGRCTFREPEHFFSHRRDGACGRMAALIWLAAAPQKNHRSE